MKKYGKFKYKRTNIACDYCRNNKLRCDDKSTCQRCEKRNLYCLRNPVNCDYKELYIKLLKENTRLHKKIKQLK